MSVRTTVDGNRYRMRSAVQLAGIVTALVLAGGALSACTPEPDPAVSASTQPRDHAAATAASTPSGAASPSPAPTHTTGPTASAAPTHPPTKHGTAAPPKHAAKKPSAGTALALLATIPIKGRAPKTGYDRVADFGSAWRDVDGNGCDTRNDILARDLTKIARRDACVIASGVLDDPYTGEVIHFVRGVRTSAAVQIDHLVALLDAWQTGAQQLSGTQRLALANDPLNLLAVDGPENESKSDGDAATWLPPVKSFRCTYVARQIAVKAAYHLWVTPAEHDAMVRILDTCPGQKAGTAAKVSVAPGTTLAPPRKAPAAKSSPEKAPPKKPAPSKPAPPKPAKTAHAVHPGSFCAPAGATGVTTKGTPMVCSSKNGDRARWRSR